MKKGKKTGKPPRSGIAKVATEITGLDEILQGGLPEQRMTIVSGGPGTGKTLLALEFLYRGAQGDEPGVFVSFEEPAASLRANSLSLGWDLAALEKKDRLFMMSPEMPFGVIQAGEFDIRGFLAILSGRSRAIGAKRVVLDAIDVFFGIFNDSVREREALHLIHEWLRGQGLTAVLTVKEIPRNNENVYPFLEFMADCVLRLDQRISGQMRTRRLAVMKYRGSGFLSNEHPYIISADGIKLMPMEMAILTSAASRLRLSSGLTRLDEMLGGGFFQGSCILLSGPTGTGKTTLACAFAQNACLQGNRVLFINFEQSAQAMMADMSGLGIDLSACGGKKLLQTISAMPESMGVEEHLYEIVSVMDAFRPQHLVVDAISACSRMGSERASFDFLVRLISACKVRGITALLVNQELENLHGISGFGISSLIDTALILGYYEDGAAIKRRLLVLKSRGSAHSRSYHELHIGEKGISLLEIA